MSPVRFGGGGGTVVQGGSGPNPTDSFSLAFTFPESNLAPTDATTFAFSFPDTILTQADAVKLGLLYADTVAAQTDALLSLGTIYAETSTAPTDAATYAFGLTLADSNATPSETVKLGLTYPDSNAAPSDARTTLARFWLTGSAGTSHVTNPANANGGNDGTSSTQQTAVAGATTETLTSSCGSGIPAGTPVTNAIYRGWFVATVPLSTSTVKIVAHSTSALFADVTIMTTTATLNSSGGTFTFDLFAAGINTLAKLQSVQILQSTTDAAAGVSPAVLTVDAGAIEITGVL